MSVGAGFLLFLLFLALKLTHVIDWSWLWVTAPLWIGFVLAVPFFILVAVAKSQAEKEISEVDKIFDNYRRGFK